MQGLPIKLGISVNSCQILEKLYCNNPQEKPQKGHTKDNLKLKEFPLVQLFGVFGAEIQWKILW